MPQKFSEYLGLGIAGNFALHLAQAGELEEFKDIITADEAAPKGLFPFYLPNFPENSQLSSYPLSSDTIQLPNRDVNVQMEPEVGLICKLTYSNDKLVGIKPTHFGAYNDCSIRVAGAKKISEKKNWGANSKGFASTLLEIDRFEAGGIMDNYSICSYLKRSNKLIPYGENVELLGYSYFYAKLTTWIQNQINTQEDFGPLEPLLEYIQICDYPAQAIISIGATRYTEYGEKTFLKKDDELFVVVYDHTNYSYDNITTLLQNEEYTQKSMSILHQRVV